LSGGPRLPWGAEQKLAWAIDILPVQRVRDSNLVPIGSDIPDLPLEFIEEAFTSFREKDVVIGPSFDGGYYLIGFRDKTSFPRMFEGISWSTKSVFEDTMKVLKLEGLTVHTLQRWRDIDTIDDLRNLPRGLRPPPPRE
jgi:glycosyltransferase A (GT-A) superfamily protein (DUF2064 family)